MTTKIKWTEETLNPTTGCTKVSEGCKNCYAAASWKRMGKLLPEIYGGREFTDVRCHPERLDIPDHWKKPRRIFVDSMSDLFHESVSDDFIRAVFFTMARNPKHTFMVLTKRPRRMYSILLQWAKSGVTLREGITMREGTNNCLPNVWLGVSVENQKAADERIPLLLNTPAAKRFVSVEPMLEFVSFRLKINRQHDAEHGNGAEKGSIIFSLTGQYEEYDAGGGGLNIRNGNKIDWVICGGESGKNARPMNPYWVRSLRDQCASAKVPFLFKQWGTCRLSTEVRCDYNNKFIWSDGKEWAYGDGNRAQPLFVRLPKQAHDRLLDGRLHDEYPDEAGK